VLDRLANSPLEITSRRRRRPPKVDNLVHGLSDALTRFLNVRCNKGGAACGASVKYYYEVIMVG
jgi:hypothetical protein